MRPAECCTWAASNGFYALSATTGVVLWSHPGFFGRSSPAVSGSVVYVAGEDGNLDAFSTPSTAPTAPAAGQLQAGLDGGRRRSRRLPTGVPTSARG